MSFSDAVHLLCRGMFGNLQRPFPVRELKSTCFKGSVGFGPWKEKAGERLANAAKQGDLPVHVYGNPQAYAEKGEPRIILVPAYVLRQMVMSRGGFPDHSRVPLKAVGNDPGLFNALNSGLLVVAEGAFAGWYHTERAKGRWSSQASKLNKTGRPSKQTESLRNSVDSAIGDGNITIAAVHRRIVEAGWKDVSVDTVGRLMMQRHLETGEQKYYRRRRIRRKWAGRL
ncbi:MAG: hypothetical protein ACLQLC_04535 [Candidatus Sulfotelmatobacter sp.]